MDETDLKLNMYIADLYTMVENHLTDNFAIYNMCDT
jgi:hypothetical protein